MRLGLPACNSLSDLFILKVMTQLSLFSQQENIEVIRLKNKVNELVTAIEAIESHVDAFKSIGNPVDEDWLENFCYEVLLLNEKETI